MERNNQLLKKLDFWSGIPLLYLLSFFKSQKKALPKSIKTVGIFAFAAIGDSILSSGLFEKIHNRFPGVKIIVFVSSSNAAIYSIICGYDQLVVLPISKPWQALPILRKYSLDLLIDTSQWSRIGAILSFLSKAQYTIGFKTTGQFRHRAYDAQIVHQSDCHELQNFEHLLTPLEIMGPIKPMLDLLSIQKADSQKLSAINHSYLVFHPWASGTLSEMREWPFQSWVELAQQWIGQGLTIVITGSAGDASRAKTLATLIGGGKFVQVMAGKLSLQETALLLLGAKAIVSVNTGVAHLADHLQVPVIALNGPTNSLRWGLVNPNSKNINVSKKKGGGFLNLGFEYPSSYEYAMNHITVQEVDMVLWQIITN